MIEQTRNRLALNSNNSSCNNGKFDLFTSVVRKRRFHYGKHQAKPNIRYIRDLLVWENLRCGLIVSFGLSITFFVNRFLQGLKTGSLRTRREDTKDIVKVKMLQEPGEYHSGYPPDLRDQRKFG